MLIKCHECGCEYSDTAQSCPGCGYRWSVDVMRKDPTLLGYKDRNIALVLCIFGGIIGLHKFYEEKTVKGVLYMFTCGLFLIGWAYDLFSLISWHDRWYLPSACTL